mgnify:FL=1
MSKFNLLILLFSFLISFFVSYEKKDFRLETYFGNNEKNYYQIENLYKFKKDNMFFDYAGSEQFKLIILSNNLVLAKIEADEFIKNLNRQMRKECRKLKNVGNLEEFRTNCRFNNVVAISQKVHKNQKFHFIKFLIVFINLFITIQLLKFIINNLKFKI